MRLSPVTTIKSRHLFPASKMSLVKVHSNEKLHLGSVDLKAILPSGLEECCKAQAGRMASFGRALYATTEDHRRRLLALLAKSWLRLVLSALVLMAQFAWFTAHFSGEGILFSSQPVSVCKMPTDFSTEFNLHQQQLQPAAASDLVLENQLMNFGDPPSNQHFIDLSSSEIVIRSTNNFSEEEGGDDNGGIDHLYRHRFNAPEEKIIFFGQPSTPFSTSSTQPSFTERLLSFLWKVLSLLKLALVLVLFELLRLSDTLVNVIRQLKDEDEERSKAPPKSPVDTGYIERNRGYK